MLPQDVSSCANLMAKAHDVRLLYVQLGQTPEAYFGIMLLNRVISAAINPVWNHVNACRIDIQHLGYLALPGAAAPPARRRARCPHCRAAAPKRTAAGDRGPGDRARSAPAEHRRAAKPDNPGIRGIWSKTAQISSLTFALTDPIHAPARRCVVFRNNRP